MTPKTPYNDLPGIHGACARLARSYPYAKRGLTR